MSALIIKVGATGRCRPDDAIVGTIGWTGELGHGGKQSPAARRNRSGSAKALKTSGAKLLHTSMPDSSSIPRNRHPYRWLPYYAGINPIKQGRSIPPADRNHVPSPGDTANPDELKDDLEKYEHLEELVLDATPRADRQVVKNATTLHMEILVDSYAPRRLRF